MKFLLKKIVIIIVLLLVAVNLMLPVTKNTAQVANVPLKSCSAQYVDNLFSEDAESWYQISPNNYTWAG